MQKRRNEPKMKEISKGVHAIGQFLYLKNNSTLIISDLHAGYEESLNKEGVFIPKSNTSFIIARISEAIKDIRKNKWAVSQIVLNGDVVHSFSRHSSDERYILNKLLGFLSDYGRVFIIKGNHDKMLDKIMDKSIVNTSMAEHLIIEDILITHGDILDKNSNSKQIKTIIIGHDHPSIILKSGSRSERFKCILKGKYKKKTLMVMPSCNTLIEGTDILTERMQSPYIDDIMDFDVYIIGDEIYDFGKAKNLQ
jgi:uncharacterized protein